MNLLKVILTVSPDFSSSPEDLVIDLSQHSRYKFVKTKGPNEKKISKKARSQIEEDIKKIIFDHVETIGCEVVDPSDISRHLHVKIFFGIQHVIWRSSDRTFELHIVRKGY